MSIVPYKKDQERPLDGLKILVIVDKFLTPITNYILNHVVGILIKGADVRVLASGLDFRNDSYLISKHSLIEKTICHSINSRSKVIFGVVAVFIRSVVNRRLLSNLVDILKNIEIKYGFGHLLKSISLLNLVDPSEFNLVHSHSLVKTYEYIYLKKIFNIPLVTTFHGLPTRYLRKLPISKCREVFNYGDLFFVNTVFAKEQLIKLGCDSMKISIIPQATNIESFNFKGTRSIPDGQLNLMSLCRLSYDKGLKYAIEATRQLRERFPFVHYKISFSIFGLFYGFFLVGVEIWYLMKGDLKSTGEIAALYGFNPDEKKTETTELVKIALNKDRKKYTEIGINPYQNFSKPGLFLIRLMYLVKAFLSNFVFKIIIKRVIGRLAIREVVDMAGIPIYAFWNAYASAQIIRKTDMRMKASVMIIKLAKHFKTKYENNTDFSKLLYDTFEFIALTKKSFYPSDLIFAKHFLKTFNIKIKDEHRLSEGYFETVKSLPEDIKLGIGQLLVLGFLLDGKIGTFEIKIIKKLKTDKIIPYSVEEIKTWTKNYTLGHGFEEMYIE